MKPKLILPRMTRRQFVTGVAAAGALASSGRALAAEKAAAGANQLRGNVFDLSIGYREVNFTGKRRLATVLNGGLPGPVLRWKQGEEVTLRVTNNLAVDSSIHWHGIILPTDMDGVPGMSFPGIRPGETFTYRFPVLQSGTYWYHSHSGYQEQTGLYGALIIDPAESPPVSYDREHVIVLSDWSDEKPERIFARLKKNGHYYNRNLRTAGDMARDYRDKGIKGFWADRGMWNRMRMSDRDISDVTGYTYTFLANGCSPNDNWEALFRKGERVLLRFVNAGAMTLFDVRIPGLKMTVVAADGQYVEPVTVDEFRLGAAETYDVIVEPGEGAYTIFAQAIDRTGYARATLTEQPGLAAEVPTMDPRPILTHYDMGMVASMSHDGHAGHGGMNHSMGMDHSMHSSGPQPIEHPASENTFEVDMQTIVPHQQLDDPGIGLRDNGRHVLTYGELRNLYPTADPRDPEREIELHLTGNMERYIWGMNGIRFANAEPIELKLGEPVRIVLVNDTMMNHPIHLHGMWSDLETGDDGFIPRKHTLVVQPGATISYRVTPEMPGRWAYHCHLLYHMMGMFRRVDVS